MKEAEILSVHYNEIALKGKLRTGFESLLIKSIKYATGYEPRRLQNRLIMDDWDDKTKETLKKLPGVSWVGEGKIIDRKTELLEKRLYSIMPEDKTNVELDVKRIDKSFESTSLELKMLLTKKFGLNMHSKGDRIRIEIMKDCFIINRSIEHGVGGVPIGSAGRILSLFSGGIDSSIVPFEMMKRGCEVDLLHVYALKDADKSLETKIGRIAQDISSISEINLYLVPFHVFGVKVMSINPRYELVLFKRFLLKLGESLCEKRGYRGIATGDSLSQVASQTLDNINAISYDIDLPVFRPFISYNKDEIIEKAKKYGLYDLSIMKYSDCCSLVYKNPATKAKKDVVKQLEAKLEMDDIIDKSLKELKIVNFCKSKQTAGNLRFDLVQP